MEKRCLQKKYTEDQVFINEPACPISLFITNNDTCYKHPEYDFKKKDEFKLKHMIYNTYNNSNVVNVDNKPQYISSGVLNN